MTDYAALLRLLVDHQIDFIIVGGSKQIGVAKFPKAANHISQFLSSTITTG